MTKTVVIATTTAITIITTIGATIAATLDFVDFVDPSSVCKMQEA